MHIPRLRHTPFLLLLLYFFAVGLPAAHAGEIIIVANKHVKEFEISKEELKAIFLGQKTEWENASKITFVILKNEQDEEDFMNKYIGRSFRQFNNYWKKQLFTGNGQMPATFRDAQELIAYIAKTDGAVGYLSADTPPADLKIIKVK